MKQKERLLSSKKLRIAFTTVLPFVIFVLLDLGFRRTFSVWNCAGWKNRTALIFTLCWSGLLSGILFTLPRLPRRIVLLSTMVLTCVLLLVHTAMFNLTGKFVSFADLGFAGDGAKFFSFTYLKADPILYVMLCGALAGSILCALLMPKETHYRKARLLVGLLAILLCSGGIFWQDRAIRKIDTGNMNWENAVEAAQASSYADFSDNNRCFHLCGYYQYMLRSLTVSTGLEGSKLTAEAEEKLTTYYASVPAHGDNAWTGRFAGKNLLFIQLESIDTWLLTEDYMPNLYQLQQESVDFTDNYTPLYSSAATFSTEFTANTGMVIPASGISTSAYTDYAYPYSLANLFKAAGYRAQTFHPSVSTIYNRGLTHTNLGYSAYNDHTAMGMADYQRDSEMLNGYAMMVENEPFLSFVITYSGHGPYTEPMDNICEGHWDAAKAAVAESGVQLAGEDAEEYLRAVAHAMETDAFIGGLLEQLRADGHINDTVLFFYTDHYCKYMSNRELVMELKGAENEYELTKTPCFFYCEGTEPQKIDKATSCMDILPTVANLFGMDTEYQYYAGTDALDGADGLVVFSNYNWYDGTTLYIDGSTEQTDETAQTTARVRDLLDNTWLALKCNWFSTLTK